MAVKAEVTTAQDNRTLLNQIEALKKQNIAMLGDGEVFVKRSGKGEIRSIKGAVHLEEKNSEIAIIQGKAMTTSKGFHKANQIAGLSIITPDRLQNAEGNMVVNPFIILDEKSNSAAKVLVKKMAIGYSPIGNLVVTSATLLYDIKMYFIQDIIKKVQYNKDVGRVCMADSVTEDEKKKGEFFRVDGDLGVWVDFSHKDILKALDTFIQKKLFAERNAQSICERLVMGKHPALSHIAYVNAVGPEKAAIAKISVVGYFYDVTREELEHIANAAERGEEIVVNGQKVETIEIGTATATTDEMEVEKDDEEVIHQAVTSETSEDKQAEQQPNLFGGGEKY
jgi:hypothetical protein